MKGHVVWRPISVWISDIMDRTDRQRHLANGIDDGQIDDSPGKQKHQL